MINVGFYFYFFPYLNFIAPETVFVQIRTTGSEILIRKVLKVNYFKIMIF